MNYKLSKRIFDFTLTLLILALFSWLLFAISMLVWLQLGRPILFSQKRPGQGGKIFNIYKFRTMTEAKDLNGKNLPDESRLTSFGQWLRSTSLDELPELWNVIRGEMSLVGPRPLLEEYLHIYSEEQFKRHSVLPGITGWAQINGRNEISWEQKFELDLWYVKHASPLLDLKIILMTVVLVIRKKGINSPYHSTAKKFTGDE